MYKFSAWDGCWSFVSIWRLIHTFQLVYFFFWLHDCCGKWKGWTVKLYVKNFSWMTVVAQTDRPKSICNSCVIKRFDAFLCYFDYAFFVAYWCLSYYGCVRSFSVSLSPQTFQMWRPNKTHIKHKASSTITLYIWLLSEVNAGDLYSQKKMDACL